MAMMMSRMLPMLLRLPVVLAVVLGDGGDDDTLWKLWNAPAFLLKLYCKRKSPKDIIVEC